jgi:hypothetical protein
VEYAFAHLGNRASLSELYSFVSERAHSRIRSVYWQEKIRQTVRAIAVPLERGVYRLEPRRRTEEAVAA